MTGHHALTALSILAGAASVTVGLTWVDAAAPAPSVPAPSVPGISVAESPPTERREPTEAATAVTAPLITFADEPTAEQREMIDWAVERYLGVGVQLPDVEIAYPVTCGGKAGRYLVGQRKVELCRPTRKLVLHELAHAWDDTGRTVDRDAFMDRRGVDHWYEDADCEHGNVSGGEQLALVMTWGLMDVDLTWPSSEYAGQPLDEQPRNLPGLDDSSPETLTELFVMLTGSDPLSPGSAATSR